MSLYREEFEFQNVFYMLYFIHEFVLANDSKKIKTFSALIDLLGDFSPSINWRKSDASGKNLEKYVTFMLEINEDSQNF